MRMTRTTWITIAVVLVAFVLAGLLARPAPAPAAPAVARAAVRVAPVERRGLPGEVRAGGFLRAREDVTVSAERPGRVVRLPVAEGAPVRKGDVVADLDDEVAIANLERARAVARETALAPEASAADLARAREQEAIAEQELARRHPVSPLDGVVELHHVDEGEYVQPGTPLVDVLDATRLVLDADVDAEVVGALRVGQDVPLAVTALPGDGQRTGKIRRIAERADARTRRFRVEVELDAGTLRPGMHAEARFELPAGEPAIYVPKAAVRHERGQDGVFVVADGVARWVPVSVAEVHYRPDLLRVVAGDLAVQAPLVVSGFSGLRDGTPVEVTR